jgi:hypothetical protein
MPVDRATVKTAMAVFAAFFGPSVTISKHSVSAVVVQADASAD